MCIIFAISLLNNWIGLYFTLKIKQFETSTYFNIFIDGDKMYQILHCVFGAKLEDFKIFENVCDVSVYTSRVKHLIKNTRIIFLQNLSLFEPLHSSQISMTLIYHFGQ